MHKDISFFVIVAFITLFIWACDETPSQGLTQAEREERIILDYLSDQNLTFSGRTEDGMYYRYIRQVEDGQAIQDSLVVGLGYTGRLFYGDIFDSSILRDDTIDVQVGTGLVYNGLQETVLQPPLDTTGGRTGDTTLCPIYPSPVIRGWVDALEIIKLGEKIEFYIPSALAYAGTGNGIIPPNTPILFEIEAYGITDSLTDIDSRCR